MDPGDVAEEVSCSDKGECPEDSADDVVEEEGGVVHGADSCDEWCEGAEEW